MFVVLTPDEIAARYRVTVAEMNAAQRQLNPETGEVFYTVPSRSGGDTHVVRFHPTFRRLYCSCKAGQAGMTCWAKRAACASAYANRQAENVAYRAEAEAAEAAKHAAIQAKARAAVADRFAELERQRDAANTAIVGIDAGRGVAQSKGFSLLA